MIHIANRECIGCELCQMDALSLNEAGVIEVITNRCIGCGLFVTTCPVDTLTNTHSIVHPETAFEFVLPPVFVE